MKGFEGTSLSQVGEDGLCLPLCVVLYSPESALMPQNLPLSPGESGGVFFQSQYSNEPALLSTIALRHIDERVVHVATDSDIF